MSDYSTIALSSIGASAFMDCTSIESFYIGPKLAYLGEDAFARCSSLTSIGIAMLQDDFLDLVRNELSNSSLMIEDAVSAMFSNVRDDGKCLVNFLDASYTNNGIIKLDNSLFGTYAYSGSKVGISSILSTSEFEKMSFINLSGVG